MTELVAKDITKRPAFIAVGWYALVHPDDLQRKPWISGAIARLESKYFHKGRTLKAQAYWVMPDREKCQHWDEPQVIVSIQKPRTAICYECKK